MKLKKALAAVLSAAMIVTSLPAAAFAESRSGNKINLYIGEDTTLTFDVGMDQNAEATIEGNDGVADVTQAVSGDLVADAAVNNITDGYYYIKDARYNADQSDTYNNNRYLTSDTTTGSGNDSTISYTWIKEDIEDNAAVYEVGTNDDGTKNLKTGNKWLDPKIEDYKTETPSYNQNVRFYAASATFTETEPTKDGFTLKANDDGTVGIKAPGVFEITQEDETTVKKEAYLNSYCGGNRALFLASGSATDGSRMYFYPVHYELNVEITAKAEGRFTVSVGDETYTVVVSDKDSGSLQEVYVGLGETEEFTVDTEGTTDNTGKVDDSVASAKITSTAEIGNEVSNITDGLYVLQDNRITDAAGVEKRYLTTKTTTLSDGYTWLAEGTADQAALFKIEANDDGTYAVCSGDQYLSSNVELTVDKTNPTGNYTAGSVAFSKNADDSKIEFVRSGDYFGIKPAEQNAYLASYRGYTRVLWQANASIATNAGSAFKVYEAYYNTKVAITGKTIGTTDVEVGDVTFRVHVIDAIKVPVMGSIDITNDSVTSGTDAEVSDSLKDYVDVSCENGKFTLTNNTVPEEIITGSVTVGGVKYSVTVGVDEKINMAVGAEKEFASSNGNDTYFISADGSVSLNGTAETNIAERISNREEIVAGEQYLIVGARVQQAMSSSVINWQASTTATGFQLTGSTIANDTDEVSLSGYENARVVFEKTGDYTYKLRFADTGKYIKFNDRYDVNVTDSADDASEITVNKNNNSTAYGDNILALTSKSLYLSDWGGKGTSKGLTLAGLGNGSEMWLYQVKDAKITVKANQTGTSYVTIGGKTYEITVGNAVAEVDGTNYISVADAVANAKSGDTVTVLDASDSETVEIPVDVKVAYGEKVLDVPYYQTGDNEKTKISAQRENGTDYVFLPSSAGKITADILKGIPEDATVSIDDNSIATITWEIGNVTVTKNITVMKSSGVSALYLSGLNQTVENLNASKNNVATTGDVVKIAANGTEQATATIKKLKGRGNTSWTEIRDNNTEDNKKPYNINLNEKTKLNVNANYKSKKWCLIANNYYDFSGTNNNTAYTLYQQIDGDAAVHAEPVDLYMNGEYRGMYLIVDKVEIGKNRVNITEPEYDEPATVETARVLVNDYESHFDANASVQYWRWADSATATRVAVGGDDPAINAGVLAYKYVSNSTATKDGGFILEVSHQYTDENCWFITNHGVMISLKEPEFATKEQMQKVAIYVQEFEDALYSETGFNSKGKHYSEYIDLASLAKTYMLSCFTAQNDFLDCSDYFYTDLKNGELTTLKAGPAWDYDVSAYAGEKGLYQKKTSTNVNGNQAWISQLLTKGDFVKELQKLQQGAFATAVDTVISTSIPNYINLTTDSLNMDQAMWKWDTTVAERAAKHLSNVSGRKTRWNEIWSDETNALRGVVIEKTNAALTATASGAAGYQWYQVDTDDMTKATAVNGATESTFIPTATGYYYVVATGAALAGTDATQMRSNAVYVEKQDSQVTPAAPSEAEKTVTYGNKVTLSVSVSPKATATYAAETPAANKVAFYCGNTLLGTVDVTYTSATEGTASFEYDTTKDILKMGENTVTAYYGGGVVLNANDVAGTIKVTVNPADQAAPAAPTAESVTRTSITLKAVDPNPNENGAKAQYRVDNGEWKDSPVFEGLRAGTAYTFAVRYAATEDGKYNASPETTATISTRKKSSSSSDTSAPTYGVSVGKTENGKLTVDPANAAAGEKVTITAKPDSGYQLDKITVKDKNNSNVKLTKVDDNEYTFTMPSGKVSVDATFVPKDTKDDNQNNNTETKENPFVDVKASDWFYGSVLKAYEAGWMSGTSAVTFAPNASTTRGMIVSVLYRLEGSPEAGDSTFTDVKTGAYYAKAVAWAAENGIVGGYGDGTFGPNDEITREQLAAILYRYAQFKDYDVSKKADLTAYSDYAQVSAYAKDAVAWANAAGILSGTSATTLSPRDHATRAQVAAILVRFTDAFQA